MKSQGTFTPESIEQLYSSYAEKHGASEDYDHSAQNFSEAYDFTTCARPDGSKYGTGGQCRKGKETTPGSEEKPTAKKGRKPSPRVSPKQAAKALSDITMSKLVGTMKDSEFDPDKVGYQRAGRNIEQANKYGKVDKEAAQKKVNKAVRLLKERAKKLREAQRDQKLNAKAGGRLRRREDEIKKMIKSLESGNSLLATQAVTEKSL